ncbi:MAG: efflux RND transporter permease subunit, partial [Chloroflexi bacterium CFX7]|nr:efflux RND transporter permease subunit [Chloroflexi bacterium CFX7]
MCWPYSRRPGVIPCPLESVLSGFRPRLPSRWSRRWTNSSSKTPLSRPRAGAETRTARTLGRYIPSSPKQSQGTRQRSGREACSRASGSHSLELDAQRLQSHHGSQAGSGHPDQDRGQESTRHDSPPDSLIYPRDSVHQARKGDAGQLCSGRQVISDASKEHVNRVGCVAHGALQGLCLALDGAAEIEVNDGQQGLARLVQVGRTAHADPTGSVEDSPVFLELGGADAVLVAKRLETLQRPAEGLADNESGVVQTLGSACHVPAHVAGLLEVALGRANQVVQGDQVVQVVQRVKDRLAEISPDLPDDIQIEVIRDQSRFIENSIHEVRTHLLLAAVLVSLTILLFIRDWRTTIIATLA